MTRRAIAQIFHGNSSHAASGGKAAEGGGEREPRGMNSAECYLGAVHVRVLLIRKSNGQSRGVDSQDIGNSISPIAAGARPRKNGDRACRRGGGGRESGSLLL